MDFSSLLNTDAVRVSGTVSSKKRLFQDLGEIAQQAHGLDATTVTEALRDREALGPTGVGHGVALPHARLAGLDRVVGVFVLLEKPIDFDALDKEPVDIAFGLFAPENSSADHLKALALVSRTLRDSSICSKLRANHDAATLFTILCEARHVRAA